MQIMSSTDSAVAGAVPQGTSCVNSADTHLAIAYNWTDLDTHKNNGNLGQMTSYHGGPGYPQFLVFDEQFHYDSLNRLQSATDTNVTEREHGLQVRPETWFTVFVSRG
jgi:hypothetical protein